MVLDTLLGTNMMKQFMNYVQCYQKWLDLQNVLMKLNANFFDKTRWIVKKKSGIKLTIALKKDLIVSYNHGHNIMRIFDVLPKIFFATSETKPDY